MCLIPHVPNPSRQINHFKCHSQGSPCWKAITTFKIPANYVGACWYLYTLIDSGHVYRPITAACIFKGTQFLKGQAVANVIETHMAWLPSFHQGLNMMDQNNVFFFLMNKLWLILMSEEAPSLLFRLYVPQFEHCIVLQNSLQENWAHWDVAPSHSHTSGLVISENWKMKVHSQSMQNLEVGNAKPICHSQWKKLYRQLLLGKKSQWMKRWAKC